MAQTVQVIVDVPTQQTNHPFTYSVPDKWADTVKPGMRVVVPFGKGDRQVQGFVVGVDAPHHFDGELRPLAALMDLQPVVNDELLRLSQWMTDDTYSFWISCLYTMLPTALKGKTQRLIRVIAPLSDEERRGLFDQQDELDFATIQQDPDLVAKIIKLRRQKKVRFEYRVKNRAGVKTITGIRSLLTPDQAGLVASYLSKRAVAQHRLLDFLAGHFDQTILEKEVEKQANISASTVKKGEEEHWLIKLPVEQYRRPHQGKGCQKTAPLKLNQEQQDALSAVASAMDQENTQTFLLQGVTGSGKTEVYLQAIAKALQKGQTALMLVPEISLTPQMVARVCGRFGEQVAILHSNLSQGERYDEWRRIDRGQARVVVGARSAIFAPLKNLGIIIMDEEHETSYKQDDSPRYHARDVAKWRAKYHQAVLLLGSATPSLESRSRAQVGVYQLLRLSHRVNGQSLPPIEVVDMRPEIRQQGETNFSRRLMELLQDRLGKGEQSILMLNRRGFSSFMMCRDCGAVLKCPNCDISLTLHMDTRTMRCHYCGHEEPIPQYCPQCHSRHIRYYGTGTEKVAAQLSALLPAARVLRMDVDTTRRKGMHEKILRQFGEHQADILLGTQMIAKGLDFPDVTLVGVLNADTGLELPDFRASEHTFDLLAQVSGRAGRADKPGHVIIQTFNPDHYAIRLAQAHDYDRFFATEMNVRYRGGYPPYYYTVRVMASHEQEAVAAKAMIRISEQIKRSVAPSTIILGPSPRPIARMKRRYYYQLVIKYKQDPQLHRILTTVLTETQPRGFRDLQVSIDPEPQFFM
ncbi:MAG: primosomal protein N' [[Lactobacillus] timonensis]|jgi:primosomal protein N' (replication factor Y)|uniref:primosomal protein N' n=1 Tax=[Lactobacillus] timonensis TaxID=1970790 RepID=UPI00235424BA|nr:primosomal protein N' [[Lactobacillus] timonensis]MCI1926012.1 primosomal protein N' [[Lactobacillus] timonensis]MCI1957378.1 primosomal protein N' [[Lactobacillus] timonensis]MCI1970476.1 primosomal protein N' [[Lactobacillus] timonensis]MCI2006566.1 primosomal protein N' [[Lactobacillus] timonensis]